MFLWRDRLQCKGLVDIISYCPKYVSWNLSSWFGVDQGNQTIDKIPPLGWESRNNGLGVCFHWRNIFGISYSIGDFRICKEFRNSVEFPYKSCHLLTYIFRQPYRYHRMKKLVWIVVVLVQVSRCKIKVRQCPEKQSLLLWLPLGSAVSIISAAG